MSVYATLAFRKAQERDGWLTWGTTVCTQSPMAHVEIILTVSCGQARCGYCRFLQEHKAHTPSSSFHVTDRDHPYHTLSFTVTGLKGRDKVHVIPNRNYDKRASEWCFMHRHLTTDEARRVHAFLIGTLDAPFDAWAFYLNAPLCGCFPCFHLGCPLQTDKFSYHDWKGGWTCSALALAALQFTGLLEDVPPGICTPHMLFEACAHDPEWRATRTMPALSFEEVVSLSQTVQALRRIQNKHRETGTQYSKGYHLVPSGTVPFGEE